MGDAAGSVLARFMLFLRRASEGGNHQAPIAIL